MRKSNYLKHKIKENSVIQTAFASPGHCVITDVSVHGREGDDFSFRQGVLLCIYSWLDSVLFLLWMSLFIQRDYLVKFLCMTALK